MASHYFVRLDHFEGPLDLLLHLIKVQEMDIFQVNLQDLTSQYLHHLRLIQFKDLTESSSFMEIAATLIAIKARQLLPAGHGSGLNPEEDLEIDESINSLKQRLLDYALFKGAAVHLLECQQVGLLETPSQAWKSICTEYENSTQPLCGQPVVLLFMYEHLLVTLNERRPNKVKVSTEALSLEKVIEKITEFAEKARAFMLQRLYAKINTRYELVAYILALLQLVAERKIKIHQEETGSPLWVYHTSIVSIEELEDFDELDPEPLYQPPVARPLITPPKSPGSEHGQTL
ncbi:MAG: segregation/condensation protein A [Oligoflexales bacterium]|nr:segregation/condensation protein A [Oligoflexales bacterium]